MLNFHTDDDYDILLVGDWAPGPSRVNLNLPGSKLLGVNLEGPVCDPEGTEKRSKSGPHLYSKYLPSGGPHTIYSLANNHSMDFGIEGLAQTTATIESQSGSHVGFGLTEDEAKSPFFTVVAGKNTGFLSVSERQFGVARMEQGGVSPLGPWVFERIDQMRSRVDLLIVSVDGGMEDYPIPTQSQIEMYRGMIAAGADVVWGHHPHVVQPIERWRDGFIAYGLGNFAVPCSEWHTIPNALWSVGLGIRFAPGNSFDVTIVPLRIKCRGQDIDTIVAEGDLRTAIETRMRYLESVLMDPTLVAQLQQEVAVEAYREWGAEFLGWNQKMFIGGRILSPLRARLHAGFKFLKGDKSSPLLWQQEALLRYHMFSCESHRTMIELALGLLSGEVRDLRTQDSARTVQELKHDITI